MLPPKHCALTLLFVFSLAGLPSPSRSIKLGANLAGLVDWTRSRQFVELMRTARPFGSATAPWDGNPGTLGPNRWPLGDFGMVVFSEQLPGTMEGNYSFVVHGGGPNVQFSFIASKGVSWAKQPTYDSSTETWKGIVSMSAQTTGMILSITGQDGTINSISIRRPGYSDTQVFTNEFLTALAPYSVLRFMDWASTNNNNITEWDQRTKPTDAFRRGGAPWEWAIELANSLNKDMWVNVPTLASDDYITELAKLLKANVNPNLHIYVEYSNELWNYGFKQFGWNHDLALEEVANGTTTINYDNNTNEWTLTYRRIAYQIKHISDIFTSVFGHSALNTRFRPVYASQVVNPYLLKTGLSYLNAVYGPPSNYLYALSGAPYFSLGAARSWDNLTESQVVSYLNQSMINMPTHASYGVNVALAVYNKLKFVSYEGGPDTAGDGSLEAKFNATTDPALRPICLSYLLTHAAYGFEFMNWFVGDASDQTSKYGSWGTTNNILDLNVPKYQAMLDAAASRQPASVWPSVPGVFDARDFIGAPATYKQDHTDLTNLAANANIDYLFFMPSPGYCSFQLNNVNTPNPGFVVTVLVNSDLIGNLTLPFGGNTTDTDFTDRTALLPAGLFVVRFTFLSTASGIAKIEVGDVTVNAEFVDSSGSQGWPASPVAWLLAFLLHQIFAACHHLHHLLLNL